MLRIRVWILTLSGVTAISYLLCVSWSLVAPASLQMTGLLQTLLPEFVWLSPGAFLVGLIVSVLWAVYFGTRRRAMFGPASQRIRSIGFVGPHYQGLFGKLRFVWERLILASEVLFVVDAKSVPVDKAPRVDFDVHWLQSAEDLESYIGSINAAYYPGYADRMRLQFSWGEQLMLAVVERDLAGFIWLQAGSERPTMTYFGPLLNGEGRLLRAAVLPAFRGQGIYTALLTKVLNVLLDGEFRTVYIDCSLHNVAAYRAHLATGFRPLALARVMRCLGRKPFVSWRRLPPKKVLTRYGASRS